MKYLRHSSMGFALVRTELVRMVSAPRGFALKGGASGNHRTVGDHRTRALRGAPGAPLLGAVLATSAADTAAGLWMTAPRSYRWRGLAIFGVMFLFTAAAIEASEIFVPDASQVEPRIQRAAVDQEAR